MLSAAMDDPPQFIRANTKLLARAAGAGDPAAYRRGVAADLAEDGGGAGRDEHSAALLGLRLGGRAGAGALSARQPRPGRRPARAGPRLRLGPRRHRRGEGRGGARAGGRHRRVRAGGHRPQRRGQRRDGRRPPPTTCSPRLRAPSMSCWSATCSTSARWPSACWPSPTPPLARGAGAGRRSPPQLFPPDRFRQLAEYSVPVTRELEDAEIKRTAVWRLDADQRQASHARDYFEGAASSRRIWVAEMRSVSSSSTRRSTV